MLRREFLKSSAVVLAAAPFAFGSRRKDGGPVIDMHAHWFPEEWLKVVEAEGAADGLKLARTAAGWQFSSDKIAPLVPLGSTTLDDRQKRMDAQGVDMQVLSLTTPMVYWASPALGVKLAKVFNDSASAACRATPKRFLAAATLPIQAPDTALKELERVSQLPGMRAICLPTSYGGKELDDKSLLPIYAKCEELGWPVLLHPVETPGRERTSLSFGLENLAGNPFDTALAAAHLIFGGVLDAYPKLVVVLPHAGGAVPSLAGRWDRGVETRPELKGRKPAMSYLRRFYYDTIAHNDTVLMNVIRLVGADRMVIGTDFPFTMGLDKPVDIVERLQDLAAFEKDQILGGSAANLLGIR